jgi:hypothetical protein
MRSMKAPERVPTMKSCRTIALVSLVLATAGAVYAGPTLIYSGQTGVLPYLSNDGTKTMHVNINFAVFDTSTGAYTDAPGPQRYVYVYVLDNQTNSDIPVSFFSLVAPSSSIAGIGTAVTTNGIDAVASLGGTPNINQSADFGFKLPGAGSSSVDQGPLLAGRSSYKLIFTSDYTYKTDGVAIIKGGTADDDKGLPNPETPEPMTVVLLGAGGLALIRKARG